MSITAFDLARLRRMISEPDNTTYTDSDLKEYLKLFPVNDEDGRQPDHDSWVVTYDLNRAAGEIWGEKASKTHDQFNFSHTQDGTYNRTQVYDNAKAQAKYYRAKSRARAISIAPLEDETEENEVTLNMGVALFVVGSLTLSAFDLMIKTELDTLGFNVITIADDNALLVHATDKALIVISSSIDPVVLGSLYAGVDTPILNLSTNLQPDLKIAVTPGVTTATETAIEINNNTNPITAVYSLTENVVIFNSSGALGYGTPLETEAIGLAYLIGGAADPANKYPLIVYSEGAAMVGGFEAPARRASFLIEGKTDLSEAGLLILKNAILWTKGDL